MAVSEAFSFHTEHLFHDYHELLHRYQATTVQIAVVEHSRRFSCCHRSKERTTLVVGRFRFLLAPRDAEGPVRTRESLHEMYGDSSLHVAPNWQAAELTILRHPFLRAFTKDGWMVLTFLLCSDCCTVRLVTIPPGGFPQSLCALNGVFSLERQPSNPSMHLHMP